MFNIPRIMISGPNRSAGKTTVTIGLCDAFTRSGIKTQAFKKGPDFIDPMWHSVATGRICHNLDFHMMGKENIQRSFQTASADAGMALVEGNQALFDGLDLEGSDCTAGLAHLLQAPVILVVDTSRMNRGIAPLLLGYLKFDPELNIAGVILNRVGGTRHETKLREAIERYIGLEVLGVIPKLPDELGVTERHLGLIPVKEDPLLLDKISVIGDVMKRHCDIDRILRIAGMAKPIPAVAPWIKSASKQRVRIGVAMDKAFTFYYPENLMALEAAGAELVPFSPISDESLPEVNGIYIGGGFPEVFMEELETNRTLRRQIRDEAENGLPIYAECGGLMYLCRSIIWDGAAREMAGVIKADVEMTKRPVGMGYMTLASSGDCEWHKPAGTINCHEFHHSRLVNVPTGLKFGWKVSRGAGLGNGMDGIMYKNVFASYAHLHYCGDPSWASDFISMIETSGKTTGFSSGVNTLHVTSSEI